MDRNLARIIEVLSEYPEIIDEHPDLITDFMLVAGTMYMMDHHIETLFDYFGVDEEEQDKILRMTADEIDQDELMTIVCWIKERLDDMGFSPQSEYVS